MLRTRMGISHDTRASLISLLQAALVDAVDLRLACKQAHWNVRDKNFFQLHELFDKFVGQLDDLIDEVAERIATLGGEPDGRAVTVARTSRLETYPSDAADGKTHVTALADRIAALGDKMRIEIGQADGAGDAVTADLVTSSTKLLDQMLWTLEAHDES